MKKISLVIPMYNEQEMIPLFFKELYRCIEPLKENYTFEIVTINDGSSDNTLELLKKEKETNNDIVIVDISHSGHEKALRSGLINTTGDAIIPMDADLQDPPSVIPKLIAKWEEGYDVVNAKRVKREKDSFFKRVSAKMFYKYLNRISKRGNIPQNVGNFRLISGDCLNSLLSNSRNWVFRVEVACSGYSTSEVEYEREERQKGKTKYHLGKMIKLAIDSFIQVSKHPTSWINPVVIPYGIITLVSVILGTTLMSLNSLEIIISVSYNGLLAYQIVNIVLVVILLVLDAFVLYTRNEYKKMKNEPDYNTSIIKEVLR